MRLQLAQIQQQRFSHARQSNAARTIPRRLTRRRLRAADHVSGSEDTKNRVATFATGLSRCW